MHLRGPPFHVTEGLKSERSPEIDVTAHCFLGSHLCVLISMTGALTTRQTPDTHCVLVLEVTSASGWGTLPRVKLPVSHIGMF